MPKTTAREETASVGSQKANAELEKHAHSSVTRTRKAKGRDDLVHLLRQVHRTEIRKVSEKVVMTGSAKGTPKFTGKSPSGKKWTGYLAQTSREEVAKGDIHVSIGMFPKVQISKRQVDADSETSVHTRIQLHLLMKDKISIYCNSRSIE